MKAAASIDWISNAIDFASKSAKYLVSGTLSNSDPGIEIEGLGKLSFPLKPKSIKLLIAKCEIAPYGKGTKTLVNRKVRNTMQLDASQFNLSDEWNREIANLSQSIAQQLGLVGQELQAVPYKLLVYEPDGFFLPHRDSEKLDRMVASMIVVLPNVFDGGRLIVRHGKIEQEVRFEEAAKGKAAQFAAFYADCEHEVRPVRTGRRICLAYNLVLARKEKTESSRPEAHASLGPLAKSIQAWTKTHVAKPLVFALEHHYTQHGLSQDLLKGADRQLVEQVIAAAEQTHCVVHLAQVTRHLLQHADDGSYSGYYSRKPSRHSELEIGETYEDELVGTEWTDLNGKKQPWSAIPFDLAAIVSQMPIDDWTPTSEEFEGNTGNAGNTLDRWYHRSAIVVWHRDHHFEVMSSSGATNAIPLFCSMANKLKSVPKKKFEAARADCTRFAQAIIASWPRNGAPHGDPEKGIKSVYDEFANHLYFLHDQETIAQFLATVAERDETVQLHSLVLLSCHEFGWGAFTSELKRLLAAPENPRSREDVPHRDVEWLSAICCEKSEDPVKTELANQLCTLAVEQFCQPFPPHPTYYSRYYRRGRSVAEASLLNLLKALLATKRDRELATVITFVQKNPQEYRRDECQVPALKKLIPWSQKRLGKIPARLTAWLADVRAQFEQATVAPPTPPADWARPAEVKCSCQFCGQLNTFLADPNSEVGRISAREDLRRHVLGTIEQHQCDVTHKLDRSRSPFTLVLTKTTGSFARAVEQYKSDCSIRDTLPNVSLES